MLKPKWVKRDFPWGSNPMSGGESGWGEKGLYTGVGRWGLSSRRCWIPGEVRRASVQEKGNGRNQRLVIHRGTDQLVD